MIKLLRDPAFQAIAGVLSLIIGVVALVLSSHGNSSVTAPTSIPSAVGVNLPFDAIYDVTWTDTRETQYR